MHLILLIDRRNPKETDITRVLRARMWRRTVHLSLLCPFFLPSAYRKWGRCLGSMPYPPWQGPIAYIVSGPELIISRWVSFLNLARQASLAGY